MLKKQQWIAVSAAAVLLLATFAFGRFSPKHKDDHDHNAQNGAGTEGQAQAFDINAYINQSKQSLTPSQSAYLTSLEDALTRGDLVTQRKQNFQALSDFWKDSARSFLPFIYYYGEKAKLENSEKSLNFAAHSMLEELRGVSDPGLRVWMANEANDLFTRSLKLNPDNDSTVIGQGSTFFFGVSGAPMEGIMKIRAIAEKDPNNVFAQFMLGFGGMVSGQNDKAIERFLKVIQLDPKNSEAIFLLAELYERAGDKTKAVEWYEQGKKFVENPELMKALDEKIKSLK
jgi:tetratricopeptide (TPR) repeat protein